MAAAERDGTLIMMVHVLGSPKLDEWGGVGSVGSPLRIADETGRGPDSHVGSVRSPLQTADETGRGSDLR